MSEPTLYRIVAPLDKQKWPKGPKQVLVHAIMVSVEPCEHGKIDPHYVWTLTEEWGWWKPCPGAGIGGDDE